MEASSPSCAMKPYFPLLSCRRHWWPWWVWIRRTAAIAAFAMRSPHSAIATAATTTSHATSAPRIHLSIHAIWSTTSSVATASIWAASISTPIAHSTHARRWWIACTTSVWVVASWGGTFRRHFLSLWPSILPNNHLVLDPSAYRRQGSSEGHATCGQAEHIGLTAVLLDKSKLAAAGAHRSRLPAPVRIPCWARLTWHSWCHSPLLIIEVLYILRPKSP
mmetsp:Transcript_32099/g.73390  ORF Transcript_32099/g.73390 Transcript_32099/m.73390 type:complete len:220 (-) Transcript_32099:610-1269(-)